MPVADQATGIGAFVGRLPILDTFPKMWTPNINVSLELGFDLSTPVSDR